ncbi:EscU/YscU/HrcU family type III secretion system export apparatus switch protein [Sphingobium sufflavum]|uniref:EscU/YscU/HrcU family type III secretion system export apparatus switch protein n=1 Tax=Sphingobium sufflavum TaxID=1129547 RepID=UPI001F45413C|nr:flagellar type III secretion system protein FlhB [Sphingobium sufflavum]MCE7795636.1 EscU/YscU/HrcU family type III secretion system export apparatus switch protein [Sphingobium sufflavum]
MAETAGEKSEKPTAKRLSEAAKNGDILQSKDLATAMVVMAGIATLAVMGPEYVGAVRDMLREGLRITPGEIQSFAPGKRAAHLAALVVMPVAAILATTFLAAVAAPALLGSLGFRPGAFAFKASKLNPGAGLKRIFGPQGVMELIKSVAKVVLLGAIGWWLMWDRLVEIRQMGKSGIVPAFDEIGNIFIMVSLGLAGALFVVAGIDVPAQIMQRAKRLNMSKQEVKDEYKEAEGSGEAKGAMRRRAAEVASGSVRKAVSEASVILTNPTHFAVALRYRPGVDQAPVVLARGADEIARIIRESAGEFSVPVLQYPELTRAIYFTSRVNHVIDERLFLAVATILAFVFRIENNMATQMDRPHIDLPEDVRFDAEGRKTQG